MGKKKPVSSEESSHKPKIIHVYPKEEQLQSLESDRKKRYIWLGFCLIGLVLILVVWKLYFSPNDPFPKQVLVNVNNVPITVQDVAQELTKMPKNVVALQDQEKLKSVILEQLVVKQLLLQKAEQLNLKVTNEEIEQAIKDIKTELGISEEEFNKVLAEQGITLDVVKQTYGDQLLISKVMKQVLPQPIVVEDEVKAYYEENKEKVMQVKASHVLVCYKDTMFCTSQRTEAEAKAKAEEVLAKAKAGADFAELAKQYSDDNSAQKGGDLGYFSKGQMVKEFEDVAFALSKDQISNIVKTQFGLHVIKVVDKQVTFDELKDKIKKQLQAKEGEQKVLEYINELKAKAKIEYKNKSSN